MKSEYEIETGSLAGSMPGRVAGAIEFNCQQKKSPLWKQRAL